MSKFDEFMALLEAAIGDTDARIAFIQYVHNLTPEEQASILAEAGQRDPEGSLEWTKILDMAEEEYDPDLDSDQVN